jgi:hypothetical protein
MVLCARGFGGLPPRDLIQSLETTEQEITHLLETFDGMPNGLAFIDRVPSSALTKESPLETGFAKAKHRARNYNSLPMQVYGGAVAKVFLSNNRKYATSNFSTPGPVLLIGSLANITLANTPCSQGIPPYPHK